MPGIKSKKCNEHNHVYTFNSCQDLRIQGSFSKHSFDVWDALNLLWNKIVQEVQS